MPSSKKLFDTRAGGLRPQRDRRPASGGASSTSSARRAWSRRSPRRGRQQERGARAGAVGRQEDRRLHHPDLPVCAGGGARAGGDRRASASRSSPTRRTARRPARRRPSSRPVLTAEELKELEDGGEVSTEDILAAQMAAAPRQGHHLRGLHRHAQGQDAGAVRHAAATRRSRPGRTTCRRRSTSTRCGRPSRRASSSTCCRTTRPTSWPSGWPTTARRWTTRRSSAARP